METTLSDIVNDLAASDTRERLEAVAARFDLLGANENPAQVLFYKGLVHFKLQTGQAAELFAKCVELDPGNFEAWLYCAVCMVSTGTKTHNFLATKRDYLKRALDAASAVFPDLTKWFNYTVCLDTYAGICMGVGPHAEAEASYRKLIELHPTNPNYHAALAHAMIEQGKGNDLAGLKAVKSCLERALELAPNAPQIQAELEAVNSSIASVSAKAKQKKIGRYPDTEEMRGEIADVIRKFITNQVPVEEFIGKETLFTTMGSCFASEISRKLLSHGYKSTHFDVSEFVNSTYANRYMVDWAVGACSGQPKERLDELFSGIGLTPDKLLDYWSNADVVVYTLGVAPAFFDKKTGDFIMPKGSSLNARALAEKYEFRTTTVAENVQNLEYIYSKLREFNKKPTTKFVITLSPVPLRASFEFESAMFADCISKSTLRVVAHEFSQAHAGDVFYWPSFEIVKWLGGHIGPFYGVDDGASWHISEDLIHVITDLFIEHFSYRGVQQASAQS